MPVDPQAASRKRTVHQLDTPFSGTSWPEISPADQEEILELLCRFLQPVGQHRRNHVRVSKGKRAAKRAKSQKGSAEHEAPDVTPPAPELSEMIDVGLSSITRSLGATATLELAEASTASGDDARVKDAPYTMVFVARGDQPSTFNCHFPKMVAASCSKVQSDDRTRLVGFSKPSSERLSRCLDVARVSSVAVRRDAPGAGPLWDFVRQRVKPIEASWLESETWSTYKSAKINSMETIIGPKKTRTA